MDFLGVGPAELLLILIIALIAVGPERLPEIARTITRTLNNLRAMSQALTAEWQDELKAVNDIKAGAQELRQSLTEPFKAVQADLQQSVAEPLKAAQADLQQGVAEPLKQAQEAQTEIRRAFSQPFSQPQTPPPTPAESAAPAAPPAAAQPMPGEPPAAEAAKPAPPLMLPLDPPPASDGSVAQPQPVGTSDGSSNHNGQAND